jgi:hypothetical protein
MIQVAYGKISDVGSVRPIHDTSRRWRELYIHTYNFWIAQVVNAQQLASAQNTIQDGTTRQPEMIIILGHLCAQWLG